MLDMRQPIILIWNKLKARSPNPNRYSSSQPSSTYTFLLVLTNTKPFTLYINKSKSMSQDMIFIRPKNT